MALTKTHNRMISGSPASVLDYGADPTGVSDSTSAIQSAIDDNSVVYIPSGTYLISGPINVGSATLGNRRIFGEGPRNTIIKATDSSATIQNKTQHYWIQLEDFAFEGDNIASVGMSFGIPSGGTGTAAYDFLTNVHVANCTTIALELNSIQYVQIKSCQFQGTSNGHGIKAQRLLTSTLDDVVIIDNRYGFYLGNYGGASSGSYNVWLNRVDFFGPAPASATPPDWYFLIDGAYGVYLDSCSFENERVFNNSLVTVNNTNGSIVTGNIYFQNCNWVGLAFANDLISISSGTRIYFDQCRAIRPTSGNYILNTTTGGSVFVTRCLAGTGYTDNTTYLWSDGGYTNGDFYNEALLTGVSVSIQSGVGSPEGSVTAPVGSLFQRTDGGANTSLYVKESGSGNTGWVAK